MTLNSTQAATMSRRSVLAVLSSAGLGAMIAPLHAQANAPADPVFGSADPILSIAEMLGLELTDEEVRALSVTVQRVLAQFQPVRDMAIEDRVEPAHLFRIGDS
jgi:hypothetical protein